MAGPPTEDTGGHRADTLDVAALCKERGWNWSRLARELRRVAKIAGITLPSDDSLRRRFRGWANSGRQPDEMYTMLLRQAFGLVQTHPVEHPGDFLGRIDRGFSIDKETVAALEAQTDGMRLLDRRLGAHRLLSQSEMHARTIADLVQWSPEGHIRRDLAAAGAEAAALAGWQALDLGQLKAAWNLHTLARGLAGESGYPSIIAHVFAQQAYALLDAGRAAQAAAQFEAARAAAGTSVPGVVRAWLITAEAEARAANGERGTTLKLLDRADRYLSDDAVPGIFLDPAHLARWRGHCLARLGHEEAVTTLTSALEQLDPEFNRAAAGLHTDLAIAHDARGDRDGRHHHAEMANSLSSSTGSTRQRLRIQALLDAEGEQVK
ncbi:hypothetical protein [Microlunatus speluncae]|uniref:hypothetical protein n=1 Tax=Microlunatus speluncae TaxID=2594267 RepID=UPI0012666C35|nr:hypothetical protein [Microlunatus speluncae]